MAKNPRLDVRQLWRSPGLIATTMSLDPVLELSVEQLVKALNKKLFVECTRLQSAVPPMSRALVATLATEVQSPRLKGNREYS